MTPIANIDESVRTTSQSQIQIPPKEDQRLSLQANDCLQTAQKWAQTLTEPRDLPTVIRLAMIQAEQQEHTGAERKKLAEQLIGHYIDIQKHTDYLPPESLQSIASALIDRAIDASKENSPSFIASFQVVQAVPDSELWLQEQSALINNEFEGRLQAGIDGKLFFEIVDYILPRIQQVAGTLEGHENTAAELAASLLGHSAAPQYRQNFSELVEETLRTLILFAKNKIDLSNQATRQSATELPIEMSGNQQTCEDNEQANEQKKKKNCCVIN